MEKHVSISKKLWNMVRFVFYMLHKGISKHKLLADFNATLKHGKSLMFHNRRRVPTASAESSHPRKEYEFSCNTPGLSVEALTALSPYLPGFGLVRPLRVTDSPFPLPEDDDVANGHVDEAAEEFIKKFYKKLNQQKKMV